MKAMVLSAPNELAVGEVARPPIGGGQVLVRVTYSGICGTDYKIYSGAIPVRYPCIMGHEMIGEVVEAGANAAVRPGDRAIIDPELYCGACFHCRIGQTHLCPKGMLLGRDTNVSLRATDHPEFDAWRWHEYWVPLEAVIDFKREVYRRALIELERFLHQRPQSRRQRLYGWAHSVMPTPYANPSRES